MAKKQINKGIKMAKKQTNKQLYLSKEDLKIINHVMKQHNIAFALAKSDFGYNLVRYKLNIKMEGITSTIQYMRVDTNLPDKPNNRITFTTQYDAEVALLDAYKKIYEYYNGGLK